MRIAFDATSIPRLMAGAGVYTDNLIRALARIDDENEYVLFTKGDSFDGLARERPSFRVVRVGAASRATRLAWEQLVLPVQLRAQAIDVLHSPHHTTPLLVAGCRRVVTFHDLTFFILPERYPRGRRLYFRSISWAAARAADMLVCPSQAVRNDIVRILHVPPDKVRPIAEAAAPAFHPIDDSALLDGLRYKYLLPDRFILSVGSLEPGKNRTTLLKAFAELRRRGVEQKLVVAGQRAWKYGADLRLAEDLGLKGEVIFTGYIAPEEMPVLYNAADLFVFPSLYEGFGLPVLEAMACGVPVVASNVSSIPEVTGDAALLVDPRDDGALCDAMERILKNGDLRATLRQRGLERAVTFSWEKAASETIEVYEEALRKG
jgi:glycosyltransferase involved in cell wall biosynthesis